MNNNYKPRVFRLVCTLAVGCISAGPLLTSAAQQTQGPTTGSLQTSSVGASSSNVTLSKTEREVLALSQQMWRWMSERNVDGLSKLFNDKAMFVHMSRTLTKSAELDVIRSGNIQYKKVDIQESSVRLVGSTAVVLTKMRLGAVVRDNEVTNPFVVTEVYVHQGATWTLASLAFTRLVGD